MRLPNSEHAAHPWVITRIAPDFRLLDVWALPIEGGRDDFGSVLETFASFDPAASGRAASALFVLRRLLGRWLRWDRAVNQRPIPGCNETSLAARLREDLHKRVPTPAVGSAARQAGADFVALYRSDDEWAAELSNDTMHGVIQLTWIDGGDGRYRARLAVYVKPRGLFGEMYMALIQPFRHLVVYPALTRGLGHAWQARGASDVRQRRGRRSPGQHGPRAHTAKGPTTVSSPGRPIHCRQDRRRT